MPPEKPPKLDDLQKPHRLLVIELGHLRGLTGRGLRPFGQRAQMAFTRVRRIESGQVIPTVPEVRAWAAAADVTDPDTIDRLVDLAERAHTYTSPWATLLPEGPGRHLNHIAGAWEESSGLICSYQQFIVPGLLATERYTRALVPHLPVDVDVDAHVAGQMNRQDLLFEPGRRFRFLLTRRAWTWNPDPAQPHLMAGQQDRLRRASEAPTVEVRLLEDDAAPMGGYTSFTLYDQRGGGNPGLVVIEIERGSTVLQDVGDVAHYRQRFEAMWSAGRTVEGS